MEASVCLTLVIWRVLRARGARKHSLVIILSRLELSWLPSWQSCTHAKRNAQTLEENDVKPVWWSRLYEWKSYSDMVVRVISGKDVAFRWNEKCEATLRHKIIRHRSRRAFSKRITQRFTGSKHALIVPIGPEFSCTYTVSVSFTRNKVRLMFLCIGRAKAEKTDDLLLAKESNVNDAAEKLIAHSFAENFICAQIRSWLIRSMSYAIKHYATDVLPSATNRSARVGLQDAD